VTARLRLSGADLVLGRHPSATIVKCGLPDESDLARGGKLDFAMILTRAAGLRWLCIAAAAAAVAHGAAQARAIVIPASSGPYWVNSGPIPSDGSLVFQVTGRVPDSADAYSIVVQGPDGEVAGRTALVGDHLFWTPAEPMLPGDYSVSVECVDQEQCFGGEWYEFQVVEPLSTPAAVDLQCELVLEPTVTAGAESVCCPDPAGPEVDPEQCFATTEIINRVGLKSITCQTDLTEVQAGQMLFELTEHPAELPPSSRPGVRPGQVAVTPRMQPTALGGPIFSVYTTGDPLPLPEGSSAYCVRVEIWDMRGGEPFSAEECVAHPDSVAIEQPRQELTEWDLGLMVGCFLPPPGYLDQWCAANAGHYSYSCVQNPSETLVVDEVTWPEACALYRANCPVTTSPADADAGTGAPPGFNGMPESSGHSAGACTCTVASASPATSRCLPAAWVLLVAAGVLRRRARASQGRYRRHARRIV